ncbi:hypothetical protein AZE42_07685 [Rhizopogon vesiculosus]|uniref:F-box domain-containing protein n=1 Tax=Rhizopogon vesiculosus TaxID=180088 RepID=A0A1J8QKV1_9AGAM|nr:hypothetical protein AZE42_07685 [Rhizopogon vesiculosus]
MSASYRQKFYLTYSPLDVLWKDINGFKPLLSYLPSGVVITLGTTLTLQRHLFNVEWEILGQFSRRIRSLTIESFELDMISDRVVQALVSTPPFALFPNLRSLQWCDDRDCFLPLLRTLLVPTVRSMTLCSVLAGFEPWTFSFAKSTILASLGTRCPSIQKFICECGGGYEETSDAVCKAVRGFHDLVHLATGVLNAQALAHLASVPSLKSLDFMSYEYLADSEPNSIPTFTSKLDAVYITAVSQSHLTQCLRNVRFPSSQSATLYTDCNYLDLPYDPLDIPDLIISFSECFAPVLEQLVVEIDFDGLHENVLKDPHFAFGFDVFAPLLSFTRLTKLDIDWICISSVDDDALKIMVQAWPQLEVFSFGGGAWLVPPSITFIGLAHITQHCRHLRQLEISFHAFSIDTNSEPFSATIPNENITSFFVGISPIVNTMAVACQLHALMPHLTGVGCFEGYLAPSVAGFND